MNKGFLYSVFTLLLSAAMLALSGCDNNQSNPNNQITTDALIVLIDGPDTCNDYMIEIGKFVYKPENLSSLLKVDSLKVNLTYELNNTETYNCGFGGYVPVIRIINIEILTN